MEGMQYLSTSTNANGGTTTTFPYYSNNGTYGLISSIPDEKRLSVLEACNILNSKVRFLKFTLDFDGDVNIEYDLPEKGSDTCIGEMALELFLRTMHILDSEYEVLTHALYSDSDSSSGEYNPEGISELDLLNAFAPGEEDDDPEIDAIYSELNS